MDVWGLMIGILAQILNMKIKNLIFCSELYNYYINICIAYPGHPYLWLYD